MPTLSRNAPRLLRFVAGKAYARAEDHEEAENNRTFGQENRAKMPARASRHWESDDNLMADPMSTDDEAPAVKEATPPPQTNKREGKAKGKETVNIHQPPAGAKRKLRGPLVKPRPPTRGSFERGREEKRRRMGGEEAYEEKENRKEERSGQSETKDVPEDDGPKWGFEHTGPKRQKSSGYNHNTFASSRKSSAGINKAYGSAAPTKPSGPRKPVAYGKKSNTPSLELKPMKDEDADPSDSDDGLLKLELPEKKPKDTSEPAPTKSKKESLRDIAAQFKRDHTPASSQPNSSNNTSLPNLDPNISSNSTPISSPGSTSHPKETIKDLETYLAENPETLDADDQCPLCEEPVDPSHYADFWIGKKKTVRYQQIFCKEHRKRKALKEYRDNGYPEIDWDAFPDKIRDYHPSLIAVLRNEKKSQYRDEHAQRLADRDARQVRKLIDSDALFEASTGYYGARGKRAMMEAIVEQLRPEIKECVEKDAVVSFNGFANFIQAVLVPELTVWMVMDNHQCSEGKAKEIVRESGGLGEVVNEEVEDRVRRVESDESGEED